MTCDMALATRKYKIWHSPWLGAREDFEVQILSNTPAIDFEHIFRTGNYHLKNLRNHERYQTHDRIRFSIT